MARYFEEHYAEYEDEAEFFNDPNVNQWLYDIPSIGYRIEITCDDNGNVTENRYPIEKRCKWKDPLEVYEYVKNETKDLDAIYGDYIASIVGLDGLLILMEHGFIETCGMIDGRQLYILR
ncbi:MAG: hypothetical protein ACI4TD_03290 [Phocaeicola sp.]